MIQATGIYKSYGSLQVLKGVDISVKKGEIVAIVGPSGAGKSTLLHILGTIDKADLGELTIDGKKVSALSQKELSAFRNNHIGFVFQHHHLLPEFTAIENICIPAFIAGVSKSKALKRASELLDAFHLSERKDHKPSQLSGGELQRISVARALMNNPEIILADEPSGNLDTQNATELHQLFLNIRKQFGNTFVIVTHNLTLAELADRKLSMKDGIFM